MQIAMSKTRQQFPLSPKKPLKKTIASMVIWFIVLLVLYVFLGFNLVAANLSYILPMTIGFLVVFFLVFIITYIYQKLYYEVYFYDLTDRFIVIRKGVVTPREITVPYERVQDVYVDQDIFDRIFRLYDVHLSSATISSGIEAHIDGVERTAAQGLREMLLKTVSERISKRTSSASKVIPEQPPNVQR